MHLAPKIIGLYFKVKDLEHFILISDSFELACMPKGSYYARGRECIVTVEQNIILDDQTIIPAKYFQLDEKKVSIIIGKNADFVIVDNNFNVTATDIE